MKTKLLLRIAAVIMLLHTLGHTMGALTWKEAPNTRVAAVISGMQNEYFNFMGRSLTLASFFDGYGFSMIGVLLLVSILLWVLSTEPVGRIILALGLFLVFMGVIELIYFFPFAAAFSLLAGIATLIAYKRSWQK
jgi:hypothetical protein